jgi:tetratricopeptide (TPR) repeat protein
MSGKPKANHSATETQNSKIPARPAGEPNLANRWRFRLASLILVPLVALALLEAGLRLAGFGFNTDFFRQIEIGGQAYLVNNESFSLRFFSPGLARFSGPIRMALQKPAGTYRIFILGESAAMGDPEPAFGVSRYLEVLLRERFPQQKFEIVNTAFTAINSHVILPIARDCARRQGDLWIIYMGNNEMVGPFGAATVFGAQAPGLARARLNLALQRTRTGQLLAALSGRVGGKKEAPAWGGMEMFMGSRLPPDDPRKEQVYRNFQRNLRDIVRAGLDSGARVVLNTVAVNLSDCPPFASLSSPKTSLPEIAFGDQMLKSAEEANKGGNNDLAAKLFEVAAGRDAERPDVQFRWADLLARMTNFSAAREHFQRACDQDALPFRTDSRINGVIRDLGRASTNPGLRLLDPAAMLGTNNPAGVCGAESFYEHVHFNFSGNYRLGLAWAEQVEQMLPAAARNRPSSGWASQEACDRLLGLTAWNRALVIQSVIKRFNRPPLASQFNNFQRRASLENELKELRAGMTRAAAERAKEDFQVALNRAPDDHYLHETFAAFLQSIGDLKSATMEWRRVHELLPQDFLSYLQLGRLLSMQGQWAEAEICLSRVIAMHPELIEARTELGNVHAGQGKYEVALADYEMARQAQPADPRIFCGMGKALAKLKRRPEAIEKFRQAIQLNPEYWDAHFELAGELSFDERIPEATAEFAEAVRLEPANPRSRFNLGVLLAKQRRFEEARREFEETLRLEPGNQTAALYLSQVKALQGQSP